MTRGDIVLVRNDEQTTGSEQSGNRPAVIVSNNLCNRYSPVIEIVYTTTSQGKAKLPTHVILKSTRYVSIALCEAVYSISKERIVHKIAQCTLSEISQINKALKISLDLGE